MAGSVTHRLRSSAMRAGRYVPPAVRDVLRPLARKVGLAAEPAWWATAPPPWTRRTQVELGATAWCNLCRWTGDAFEGEAHVESARCPRCGSIARDRFLMWCFVQRDPQPAGARVLETSPRLGESYRQFMRAWFDYRASDFDLSAHVGDIRIDLQDIDLPTASLDVVLTPHVLEHVPDTGRALAELFRVIAPGGRMYLQVPLLRGETAVPVEPEFHADHTPVFFNFGWDLTDQVRAAGFEVDVLVPHHFRAWLAGENAAPQDIGDGFQIRSLAEHVRVGDLIDVADATQSTTLGFRPSYQFVTWECRRP